MVGICDLIKRDFSDDVYEESDDDNEDNVQKIKKFIHKITIVYKNRSFFY
jgi:hypothetical protein